jgi:hypothetical protein
MIESAADKTLINKDMGKLRTKVDGLQRSTEANYGAVFKVKY